MGGVWDGGIRASTSDHFAGVFELRPEREDAGGDVAVGARLQSHATQASKISFVIQRKHRVIASQNLKETTSDFSHPGNSCKFHPARSTDHNIEFTLTFEAQKIRRI